MDEMTAWLMDGDAAIRWQTMRDLLDAPPAEYEAERAKVATEGWGARLLAHQRPDGRWSDGCYSPKWTSTFYTMQLLWQLGFPPSNERARAAAEIIAAEGFAQDGGISYDSTGRPRRFGETCISGMGLAMLSWFLPEDPRLDGLVELLLTSEQMPDGGWNCQYRPRHSTHASFNTTVLVLEGLLQFEQSRGANAAVTAARRKGEELLLAHRLFRSHTSGEVIRKQFTQLSFPGRWHYDILRALDYLAASGAKPDERATEAVELVRAKRRRDGLWPVQAPHSGQVYFVMEPGGEPSRWNTLRALRVLRWWEGGPGQASS